MVTNASSPATNTGARLLTARNTSPCSAESTTVARAQYKGLRSIIVEKPRGELPEGCSGSPIPIGASVSGVDL